MLHTHFQVFSPVQWALNSFMSVGRSQSLHFCLTVIWEYLRQPIQYNLLLLRYLINNLNAVMNVNIKILPQTYTVEEMLHIIKPQKVSNNDLLGYLINLLN